MAPNMVQPVYDYPRRYTAKQLKTIYYSLSYRFLGVFLLGGVNHSCMFVLLGSLLGSTSLHKYFQQEQEDAN